LNTESWELIEGHILKKKRSPKKLSGMKDMLKCHVTGISPNTCLMNYSPPQKDRTSISNISKIQINDKLPFYTDIYIIYIIYNYIYILFYPLEMARGDVESEIPPFRKWALRTHQCERCDSKSSQPGDERPFFCGELATWIVPIIIMGIKHGKTWQQSNMAKRLSSRNSEMLFVQKAKTHEFRKKNVDPFVTEKHQQLVFQCG